MAPLGIIFTNEWKQGNEMHKLGERKEKGGIKPKMLKKKQTT